MPFGNYEGTPMQDVPAKYLLFLFDNGTRGDVTDYIKRSMSALRQDCPDWIHPRER